MPSEQRIDDFEPVIFFSALLSVAFYSLVFRLVYIMDHSRDPCPWVALSDFGGAFCMGVRFPRNDFILLAEQRN